MGFAAVLAGFYFFVEQRSTANGGRRYCCFCCCFCLWAGLGYTACTWRFYLADCSQDTTLMRASLFWVRHCDFTASWSAVLFVPPLQVFLVLDNFLLTGPDFLFKIAVALLMESKRDLLTLDFEGVLKHFRWVQDKRTCKQWNSAVWPIELGSGSTRHSYVYEVRINLCGSIGSFIGQKIN